MSGKGWGQGRAPSRSFAMDHRKGQGRVIVLCSSRGWRASGTSGVSAGASSHGVLVREVQASGPPMVLLPHKLPPACEPPGPEAEGWADTDEEGALLFRSFCRRWILVWRFLSSLLANLRPQ